MANNFLIGVGGTGAKSVESFIHMCAAGLVAPDIWLGLVDQDQANGNLTRTKALAQLYINLRTILRHGGDGNNLAQHTGLLRTTLVQPKIGLVWRPLLAETNTLGSLYGYERLRPELQDLLDALYRGPEERDLLLTEGFRGHPSVGAAAFMAPVSGSAIGEAWNELITDIKHAVGTTGTARVFLVGSIFGGTGAAGFPTLARLLRLSLEKIGVSERVLIGGALMLPYFTYRRAGEDAGTGGTSEHKTSEHRPSSNRFLDLSVAALRYYSRLFRGRSPFDHLYMLGWNPLIEVPDLGPGAAGQANAPLLPELYAALAASKFFNVTTHASERVFLLGRGSDPELRWEDIPLVDLPSSKSGDVGTPHTPHDVKHNWGQMLRFAWAFHYIYAPFLIRTPTLQAPWIACQDEAWWRRLLSKPGIQLDSDNDQRALAQLRELCCQHMIWAASMIYASRQKETQPRLFIADTMAHPNAGNLLARPHELLTPQLTNAFAEIIYDTPGLNLEQLFWGLNYQPIDPDHRRLGVLTGLLYDLCLPHSGNSGA